MCKSNFPQCLTTSFIPILFGCVAASAHAQTASDPPPSSWQDRPYMFGDWGGERTKLENMADMLRETLRRSSFVVQEY